MKALGLYRVACSNSKWSKKSVASLAAACKTKTEFRMKHSGAYKWAYRNKLIDKLCSHMVAPKKKSKWTLEKVKLLASKYSKRTEFRNNESSAYSWAFSHGLLEEIFSHIEKTVFDFKSVKSIASEYSSRGEFAKYNEPAYRWTIRNKCLDEVCEHMARPKAESIWKKEEVKKIALEFKSKSEFRKNNGGAYSWAYKNGFLDDICSHMEITGNKFKRALYIYEFANNKAYIGLTYNYHKRHLSHMRRGPVYKETKKAPFKYIKLHEWMDAEMAQIKEIELIEKYKTNGWVLLNSVKGGALGGNTLLWTDELLKKESLKYITLKEFRDKSSSAYTIASDKGILESFDHLEREREFWDLESAKKEATKYSSRSEFQNGSNGAASWARENDRFDEVCSHMDYVRQYWDIESVLSEAKKYNSRADFQKNSGSAWMWAQRNGMLDEVCAHMSRPKQESKWNIDKVKIIAQKYSSKSEFKKLDSGAYQWAKKNKLLDNVCNYSKRKPKWDFDSVSEEAKKYKTRTEFIKGKLHAYNWARKNNCLDEVCDHMPKRPKQKKT